MRLIAITVADIDATLAWYRRILPLEEIARYSLDAADFGSDLAASGSGEVEVCLAKHPTGFLQLMQFSGANAAQASHPPVKGPGYTHICLQSAQASAALPVLLEHGLELISRCDGQGVDLGGYGVRYAYGRDPEGRMLEIEHLDAPRRGERGWITHLANVVHDLPTMTAFYRQLLGRDPYRELPLSRRATFDAVTDYDDVAIEGCWFSLGNMELEVWHYVNPLTPRPARPASLDTIGYGAPVFECLNLEQETERLATLGISLVGGRIDLGGWITRFARDPEGNLFGVQQRVTASADQSVGGMTLYDPALA